MKILLLIHRYWPHRGGAERYFREMAERLAQKGNEVIVYTTDAFDIEHLWRAPHSRKITRQEEVKNKVRIKRFRVRKLFFHRPMMYLLSCLPFSFFKYCFSFPFIFLPRLIIKSFLVKKGEFDLVIAGVFPYNIFIYLGQKIARRSKCPFIIAPFLHLGEKERGEVRRHFIIPHQLELVKKSDFSITLTSAEIPYLTSIGVDRSKIEIISPGINPRTLRGGIGENFRKKYGLSSTEKIVFQISHQAVDKGSVCLLEAMKMLWSNGYQAKLILAGPIYNDFYTHFLAQSPAVFEKCYVLEYISEQEKKDLLSAGDIFVMTSRVESFGIVYLEAWFYKKPIIAAFTESTSKIITDGHNGFLAPFGDVHFLAEYIAGLLDNPPLAQQLGEAGYAEVVNKYTWAHQFPKMEKIVKSLKRSFS